MNDLQILEGLVRIPSVTGDVAAAVTWMQQRAREDGFRVHTSPAGNFDAEIGHGQRLVLLVGHIDTVPGHIPVRWEKDELWGRGSVDAKGCLAAFYAAARRLARDTDLRVRVVGCADEEGPSRGARELTGLRPAAILIGEPSGADGVCIGYKGIVRGRIALTREVQHAGHPGEAACDALVSFWAAVRSRLGFTPGYSSHDGRLDRIASENDGLRETATGTFQVRLPPTSRVEQVVGLLRELAGERAANLAITESLEPCETDARSRLATAFRAAIRAGGAEPRLKRKTGTADFNHLGAMYPGVPMVAYGPGDSHLDHTPQERLDRAEFERAVDVLERVLLTVASSATTAAQLGGEVLAT